jgi:integrase
MINRAGAAAGLPHIHPHQLRHTLATQAKIGRIASDATFPEKRDRGAVWVRDSGIAVLAGQAIA